MKNKIKHYQGIIESTDWDDELIQQEGKIDGTCWFLIMISVTFFGLIIAGILTR